MARAEPPSDAYRSIIASYSRHTFSTTRFDASNVDTAATYKPGYSWYLSNFFGVATPASAITLRDDGSLTTRNPLDRSNNSVASAAKSNDPPYFIGTAFGCGLYATARFIFDPASVDPSKGWPSWWAMSAEHLLGLADRRRGDASGFDHFVEVDAFEAMLDRDRFPETYLTTVHDWYGVYRQSCAGQAYCEIRTPFSDGLVRLRTPGGMAAVHDVAFLWVPASGARGGQLVFFHDGLPVGRSVEWRQAVREDVALDDDTRFSIIDRQHLALIFGSGSAPLTILSVDVWQRETACNLQN